MAELHARLMGSLLARRGVDRDTAQDACQHAYLVFVQRQPAVESVEHAFRWLNITAHREVTKWQRRQRRIIVQEPPEQEVPEVTETAEPHLLLEALVARFDELSPLDREVLRLAVEERERGATRRERDRVSLQVHRARKRLRDRLGDWWALAPWTRLRGSLPELTAAVPPNLAANILTALALGGAALGSGGHQKTPVPAVRVAPLVSFSPELLQTPSPRSGHPAPTVDVPAAKTARPEPHTPSAGPLDNHRVAVDSPATPHGPIEVGTAPRQPEDRSLLCWGNWIVVPDGCIAHPLRP